MKKYFAAILLLSLFFITPVFAQNISIEQIIQAIKSDPSLLAKIQEAIKQLINQPNPVGNCYQFDKDLTRGSTGNDVRSLVRLLKPEISADYSQFNDNVFAWVKDFQAKNGVPNTGYVGPLTRAKLNQLYGCKVNPNAPVISGISGPTTLKVGEQGTWTINAKDPNNGQLSYYVNWGDRQIIDEGGLTANGVPSDFRQVTTFQHTYNSPGTYTIKFSVMNNAGQRTNSTMTAIVTGSTNDQFGPLVVSPNGGEIWIANSVHDVKWTFRNGALSPSDPKVTSAKVDLYLEQAENIDFVGCPTCGAPALAKRWVLDKNIAANLGVYSWVVATDINDQAISSGRYRMVICVAGSNIYCGYSKEPFTITAQNSPTVTVTSPKAGDKWETYTTQNISWSYPGASANSKVDLYLDGVIYCITTPCNTPDSMKYVLDKNIAANTAYNWIVGTDIDNKLIPPANYTVRICKAGTTECGSSSQFSLTAPTHLVRICPDQKVVNQMPTVGASLMPSTYFILGGTRWEINQFDLDWVGRNCSVRETVVY
jgi:hypothetical protein